ncbi:MAG TPA: hypothetical protein PKW95_22170 [bacterium]|nr:hypothetical protein [bacterium]
MKLNSHLLWLIALIAVVLVAGACPPDDDDDNDDSTPTDDDTVDDDTADDDTVDDDTVDDDTIDDDTVDDDTVDDDTVDDDTVDDDTVDDDTVDDDTTDDDTGDDDTTDDDTADDDTVDDDTVDDDTVDDDTVDDDTTDDDTADDDTIDDDTVDDDTVDDDTIDDDTVDDDTTDDDTTDDDTTGGDFWTYDFEDDVLGEPPATPWSGMSANAVVFRVYDYGGEHGQVMVLDEGDREENPIAVWGWITHNWVNLQPFQSDFNLEMAVNFTDRRTSRFIIKRHLGSYNYSEWTYRITATGDTVDVFIDHPQRSEEWTYCGSFPADEWRHVTFAVRNSTHQASLLIDDQPTACMNIDWAYGGDGWLSSFMIDHAGGHYGSGYFDDFRAYHPTEADEAAFVEAEADDDDLTYDWIDGDSEYRVTGEVSLGVDEAGSLFYLYPKYNHAWYEDCNYRTLYDAQQAGGAVTLAAPISAGSCYIHEEYHYYTNQHYNAGESNYLLLQAVGAPVYLFSNSHHGYTDTWFGTEYSYAGALLYKPRGGTSVTLDNAEAGDMSMYNGEYNDMAKTSDGVTHIAYNKYEYREATTPPYYYAYFKLAYTNSDNLTGDPEIVDEAYSMYSSIKVLVDSSDTVRIAFIATTSHDYSVDFNIAEKDGDAWIVTNVLNTLDYISPVFALDADDQLHGIYKLGQTLVHGAYTAGEWVVETIDDALVDSPQFAYLFDPSGWIHLLYTQEDDSRLYYATNRSGLWEMTELPLIAPVETSLAMVQDAAGDLHVALGAAYRLWHTSFDPDDLPADFWQGESR